MTNNAHYDYVIVGSGINSLCCAALLAKAGNKVCVLERNSTLGGCIKTEEITLPGFKHDVLSGFHPLFVTSPSYAELQEDLARHGLEYVNTDKPTAAINSQNQVSILTTDREQNIQQFNKYYSNDGDAYAKTMQSMEHDAEFTFSLLGNELIKFSTAWLVVKEWRKRKLQGLLDFFGEAFDSCYSWIKKHFQSDQLDALFAPWILHTGLDPKANFSGAMNRVIAFSLEQAGMPIVKGGSAQLVNAFQGFIEECGGVLLTNADVVEVVVENECAEGVKIGNTQLGNDGVFFAKKAVICNVTPNQLYQQLLPQKWVSPKVEEQTRNYQYGRSDMQIHLAIKGDVKWVDSQLNDVAMIHLSDGCDSVSKAVNEAERGLLPEKATVVVAQPTVLDPSRAPEGHSILWIQLQELPSVVKGDASNTIEVGDGQWTQELKNAYAERIIERLSEVIPDLKKQILAKEIISPKDLEKMNVNLVGGDPYSGHCGVQQFFMWRPLKALKNHTTPVNKLFHIGASTHPGPGLGGNSGYLVAKELL